MNVPQLRFNGFKNDAKFVIFEEIVKSISSGKSINKNEVGEYDFYGSTGVIGYTDSPDYEDNKILVARVGANAGTLYLVKGKYSVSDNTLIIDLKDKTRYLYIYYLLTNKQLNNLVYGSGQPLITGGLLKKLTIFFPSIPEQEKIASFFTVIDEKLNLLKEKKEKLELYKKGVMQQMFSQKLRFKDEEGKEFPEWEEKKLAEIADKKSSNISANKIEENFGEYIIYGASGILKQIDFYREENDYVSIIKDGAGVGRLLYCKGKSSVLGTMEIIRPKEDLNTYFLYCLLSNIDFVKYITGSTIPHIYFKDYSHEICGLPSLPEQQKIADFLSALDTKINLVSTQIEKTELWKKGLLQQMFV